MKKWISITLGIMLLSTVYASCAFPAPMPESPVQIELDWPQTRRTSGQIASLESQVDLPLELAWTTMLECKSFATPILNFDTLYVGCSRETIYALDPIDGDIKFSVDLMGNIAGMAAAPASGDFPGAILVTTEYDGRIYALDPQTGAEFWHDGGRHRRENPRRARSGCEDHRLRRSCFARACVLDQRTTFPTSYDRCGNHHGSKSESVDRQPAGSFVKPGRTDG